MRTITLSAFVDEIYQDVEKKRNDTNYIFMLGAGCSKSSGIPLAGELALQWYSELKEESHKLQEFNTEHELRGLDDDALEAKVKSLYFKLFETLFPDALSRQKEIQRLTEDKFPALGYYELAQLMKKQPFNMVITTNFDDLIYDALIYSGSKRPRVISHHNLAHFIDRGDTPHIIKLHGDAHLHPFNDTSNTQNIEEPLKSSVVSLLNNTKLIVIGYGGGDKSIADMLRSASRIAQVYWLNASTPENTALGRWWQKLSFSTYINEYDFDVIMSAIGDKFKLEKPDFDRLSNILKSNYDREIDDEIKESTAHDGSLDKLNKLVEKLYRLGEYEKGLKVAQEAVSDAEKNLGIENVDTAGTYNNLGNLYQSMDEHENALEYFQRSLAIRERILGTEHPDTAATYNNLGLFYQDMGKYDKALEYHQKALIAEERFFGTHHLDTAITYNNLGNLYLSLNEYEKSLEYYQKALAIREEILGTDHADTAETYNNLGALYQSLNKHEKALEYYQKALAIREKVLGEHPHTATTYYNLGLLYQNMLEYTKALDYYQKALKIREKVLGTEHSDTATTYNNLGALYGNMGELDKALEYYQRALAIMQKVFPNDHPHIDFIKNNIAMLKQR